MLYISKITKNEVAIQLHSVKLFPLVFTFYFFSFLYKTDLF